MRSRNVITVDGRGDCQSERAQGGAQRRMECSRDRSVSHPYPVARHVNAKHNRAEKPRHPSPESLAQARNSSSEVGRHQSDQQVEAACYKGR